MGASSRWVQTLPKQKWPKSAKIPWETQGAKTQRNTKGEKKTLFGKNLVTFR